MSVCSHKWMTPSGRPHWHAWCNAERIFRGGFMSRKFSENKFIEKYPTIFAGRPPDLGISIARGWERILDSLCLRISTILEGAPGTTIHVIQIKEKFAGLRFYYQLSGATESVSNAITEAVALASEASSNCCEKCGVRGTVINDGGWSRVRCGHCGS